MSGVFSSFLLLFFAFRVLFEQLLCQRICASRQPFFCHRAHMATQRTGNSTRGSKYYRVGMKRGKGSSADRVLRRKKQRMAGNNAKTHKKMSLRLYRSCEGRSELVKLVRQRMKAPVRPWFDLFQQARALFFEAESSPHAEPPLERLLC